MSLINKMLQDLDKRHAADGGGKSLTQQLRPVQARKDWRRIMWEVGAGVAIGAGWFVWVTYQVSPRSVVTDLVAQLQAGKPHVAPRPRMPSVAPVPPPVPVQADAPAAPAVVAAEAPAAAAPVKPAVSAATAPTAKVDMLKLATEIATPFKQAPQSAASPGRAGAPTSAAAPAARSPGKATTAAAKVVAAEKSAAGARSPAPASIDKRPRVATPAERAEEAFHKATGLLREGRVAEAMDGYKAALRHDEAHVAARQALIGLLLDNRRLGEAQQYLEEGLRLFPGRSAYAMLLARVQVERGDLEGAHELLRKHGATAADDAEYHAFDAALLQRLGRHREAISGYRAALKLEPRAGLWWMGLGISLQADARAGEALEAYRRAKAAGSLTPALVAFVDERMKQLH